MLLDLDFLGISFFFFFPILPFGTSMSIPCMSHLCILEPHNLFEFMGLQPMKNLPRYELYLKSHSYLV